AYPTAAAAAMVTVNPPTLVVNPTSATVQAGGQQAFTASLTGLSSSSLQWAVNGNVGGNTVGGTITPQGIYTAPAIDPGIVVTVSAASASNSDISGLATVNIINPPT